MRRRACCGRVPIAFALAADELVAQGRSPLDAQLHPCHVGGGGGGERGRETEAGAVVGLDVGVAYDLLAVVERTFDINAGATILDVSRGRVGRVV